MVKEFRSGDFMAIAGAVEMASWDGWRLVAIRDEKSNYSTAALHAGESGQMLPGNEYRVCQLFFERPFRKGD